MKYYQTALRNVAVTVSLFVIGLAIPTRALSIDKAAAEALLEDSKCTKCHAPSKKKDGPAYRDVAAKYRGDPEADKKIFHHVTSGEKVKFADGHTEDHKKVQTKDMAQIQNLVQWIQSLPGGSKY